MNSFYEYFAAQQKLAAYRQAKRLQRGVKLGYNQSPTADSATKFTGGAVQIGVGDFSVEYFGNSYGSGAYPFLSSVSGTFSCRSAAVGQNGVSSIIVGDSDDQIQVGWAAQSSESRFYLAITRSGATVNVYINGELKATKEQSAVKDLGDLQLAIANSSDVGFVRVWNYALSADETATLYNNGDPMGYVVPKAMRYSKIGNYVKYRNINNALGSNTVEVEGDTYTDIPITTGTSRVYPRFVVELAEKYQGAIRVEVDAECSDEGGIIIQPVEGLSGDNNASQTITQRGIYSFTGVCNNTQYLYHSFGGALNNNKTLRLYSYKAIYCGILAEYLPQNLMYGRDDKTVATSWLDSAKQLPLSDEYMEPLFQSVGGYDMTANGAPEILYNE